MGLFGGSYPTSPVSKAGTLHALGTKDAKTYDYIIVGGGTAGCCLASRLSEDPNVSVLLLERGPLHDAFIARVPLISSDHANSATPIVKTDCTPLAHAQQKTLQIAQGEALGGGSSVNAMLYTRGATGDFDRWAELGFPSWDYKSMEPYVLKSENTLTHKAPWHGASGPFVNQKTYLPFKSHENVLKAAASMGYVDVADFNSPSTPVDVCAVLDTAIDTGSHRVSAFTAYLPANLATARRSRLTICPRALASRIELANGVAAGVVFESSNGSVAGQFYARCRKEVIVACGAIASPQLLLLSGIGPREHVESHNIDCVVDLAGVGSELQDHVGVPIMYEVPLADSLQHMAVSVWRARPSNRKFHPAHKLKLSFGCAF
ncbi:Alcohol oxidase [Mycena indigotica]|uniref:Alcohol oxidase n=1 Tax=Mycena indigotica TaxID=2126181 RepID=A0A8H6S4R3_9AGAR|nr:Alcohol oxidase [Mycena indigotica]KAF7292791.1 Alcohol oxidase [Mycena indigotica]